MYSSPVLEDCWGKGFVSFSPLTPNSVSYVTKYLVKACYQSDKFVNPITGEVLTKPPVRMSLGGGLGIDYVKTYYREIIRDKGVRVGKFLYGIPRFYLRKIKELDFIGYCSLLEGLPDSLPDVDELRKRSILLSSKYKLDYPY